jgi:hypothetical protein
MKRMVLTTILAAMGGVALSQQSTHGQREPAPGAGGAPAIAPVAPVVGSSTTNNTVGGRPNLAKLQALLTELGAVGKELRPQEEKLQATDPDFKALLEKQLAARQAVLDLDNQRRELMDAKLSADPKFAPLVARRHALRRAMDDMRASESPAATAREYLKGYGGAPRRMPNMEGGQLQPAPAPTVVPAPVVVPEAEKPAGQTK